MSQNYKDTLNLPRTDFPMKANLAQREPELLKKWEETRVYEQIQKARAKAELFVLHDGPPFANGDVHMGTALNKILKDLVVKSQTMLGKRAPRSEEHTSELQSPCNLVCRLLLEKKKQKIQVRP